MSLLENCTTSLTYTKKRNKHHLDLLKAGGGQVIFQEQFQRLGLGEGRQKRVVMSSVEEHIVTTAAAAKAEPLRPEEGLQSVTGLLNLSSDRWSHTQTHTQHSSERKEEKSQTQGFNADYHFHFLQKCCTKYLNIQ